LLSSRYPERYAWQEESDLELSRREARLFRVFTERIASWVCCSLPFVWGEEEGWDGMDRGLMDGVARPL
jgi:hypothetical protein